MPTKKIIIANWKMQLNNKDSVALAKKIKSKFAKFKKGTVAICPSFLPLAEIGKILKGGNVKFGAQDVFWEERGAFTGEVSPIQLKEVGCEYVIIGHPERRKHLRENYEYIHKKARAALNNNLIPVICIGESWDERNTERRDFVLTDQLQLALGGLDLIGNQKIIIAYEPIWAIGSGAAIQPDEAEYAHRIIKLTLNQMFGMQVVNDHFMVVYGGSISSKNVAGFANNEHIDGLLVGGASLDAEEFYKVAEAITK